MYLMRCMCNVYVRACMGLLREQQRSLFLPPTPDFYLDPSRYGSVSGLIPPMFRMQARFPGGWRCAVPEKAK